MCLIVLARGVHPDYPLLLVANRDEYYRRPTRAADWWPECPDMLAGRDLQAGGTWLGVTRNGRWAAVTNYREGLPPPALRSRGELTANYLLGRQGPAEFAREIQGCGDLYNGYNLLLGTPKQLLYTSNRSNGARTLTTGIHTLSNHLLDTPWPKAVLAQRQLTSLLTSNLELTPGRLMEVLRDRTPFADQLLPSTGVDPAWERTLSPPFIVSDDYGTRSTTVLMMHRSGQVRFVEQTYQEGEVIDEAADYCFELEGGTGGGFVDGKEG